MTPISLFHDPACGTSRHVLALDATQFMHRPIVMTPLGTHLCRPSESVRDSLPSPPAGLFSNAGGEPVIDAEGRRVVR